MIRTEGNLGLEGLQWSTRPGVDVYSQHSNVETGMSMAILDVRKLWRTFESWTRLLEILVDRRRQSRVLNECRVYDATFDEGFPDHNRESRRQS